MASGYGRSSPATKQWIFPSGSKRLAILALTDDYQIPPPLPPRKPLTAQQRQTRYQAVKLSKSKRPEYYRQLDLTNKYKRRTGGGDFTPAQWEKMKELYGHRCVYCHRKMKRLTMDHVIPISKGGPHTWENIVPACRVCNSRKHDNAAPVHQMALRLG